MNSLNDTEEVQTDQESSVEHPHSASWEPIKANPTHATAQPHKKSASWEPIVNDVPKNSKIFKYIPKEKWDQLSEKEKETVKDYLGGAGGFPTIPGILSGLTLGVSEKIPGMELEPWERKRWGGTTGKIVGAAGPIGVLSKLWGAGAAYGLSKTPQAFQALRAAQVGTQIASTVGTGFTYKGLSDAIEKEEMPSFSDMAEEGVEWGLLDAGLMILGAGGRFVSSLIKKSRSSGKPTWKVLNESLVQARQAGEDFTVPERTAAKVLSILEEPAEAAKGPIEQTVSTIEAKEMGAKRAAEGKEPLFKAKFESEPSKGVPLKGKQITPDTTAENVRNLSTRMGELSKEQAPKVAAQSEEALAIKEVESELSQRYPRTVTKLDLGSNIKTEISTKLDLLHEEASKIYDEVAADMKGVKDVAKKFIKALRKQKTEIRFSAGKKLASRAKGQEQVDQIISDALHDLGYESSTKPIEPSDIRRLIEVIKRMNKSAIYDETVSSYKKVLNKLVQEGKEELRSLLKKHKPESLAKYEQAEKLWRDLGKRYENPVMLKIRGETQPERIAEAIKSPSKMRALKNVLSPESYERMEAESLEHLRGLKGDKAQKYLREAGPHLSPDAKAMADRIVNPKLSKGKSLRQEIMSDLDTAKSNATRPERLLRKWQDKEGNQAIREALKGDPNEKAILEYLSGQSFFDNFGATLNKDNGIINFSKLNERLSNPLFIKDIRQIAGEEGVAFIRDLEQISKTLKKQTDLAKKIEDLKNLPKLSDYGKQQHLQRVAATQEKISVPGKIHKQLSETIKKTEVAGKQPYGEHKLSEAARRREPLKFKFNDYYNKFGTPTKVILHGLGITLATKPYAAAMVTKLIYGLVKKKSGRVALKRLYQTPVSQTPVKFLAAYNAFDKAMSENEER